MTEFCAELKLFLQKNQPLQKPAEKQLAQAILDNLRKFQPLYNQFWTNPQFQICIARTNATLSNNPTMDAKLLSYEKWLRSQFKPQLVSVRGAIAKAFLKLGPSPAMIKGNNEGAALESDCDIYLNEITRLQNLVNQRKKELAANNSAQIKPPHGKPPSGRPGSPAKPAPRPPAKPPGAVTPPTSQQIQQYVRLTADTGGELYGPLRIPATILENRHPSATIHVTVKSSTDARSNVPPYAYPPYYQRYSVPPKAAVYVGVAVPGPTLQRFEFTIERCEL